MLLPVDRDRLIASGYIDKARYETLAGGAKVEGAENPENLQDDGAGRRAALADILRRPMMVQLGQFVRAVKAEKQAEMDVHAEEALFLLTLPVGLDLDRAALNVLAKEPSWSFIWRMYQEGVRLAPGMADNNELFDPSDITETRSANQNNILDRWKRLMDLTNGDYHLEPAFWQEVRDVQSIVYPKSDGPKNNGSMRLMTDDNPFWRAARAGEFGRLLEIYKQENRAFPVTALKAMQQDIGLMDILLARREPGVFESLFDPALWRGQGQELKEIWHNRFPTMLQKRFPLDDILQRIQMDTVQRRNRAPAPPVRRRGLKL